jgi:hypothetical protein
MQSGSITLLSPSLHHRLGGKAKRSTTPRLAAMTDEIISVVCSNSS